MNQKLTEYHTGYRAYSAEVLKEINFELNSDDFIFDNEMIALMFYKGFQDSRDIMPYEIFRRSIQYKLQKKP
jgi:hypothetical protein